MRFFFFLNSIQLLFLESRISMSLSGIESTIHTSPIFIYKILFLKRLLLGFILNILDQ